MINHWLHWNFNFINFAWINIYSLHILLTLSLHLLTWLNDILFQFHIHFHDFSRLFSSVFCQTLFWPQKSYQQQKLISLSGVPLNNFFWSAWSFLIWFWFWLFRLFKFNSVLNDLREPFVLFFQKARVVFKSTVTNFKIIWVEIRFCSNLIVILIVILIGLFTITSKNDVKVYNFLEHFQEVRHNCLKYFIRAKYKNLKKVNVLLIQHWKSKNI